MRVEEPTETTTEKCGPVERDGIGRVIFLKVKLEDIMRFRCCVLLQKKKENIGKNSVETSQKGAYRAQACAM